MDARGVTRAISIEKVVGIARLTDAFINWSVQNNPLSVERPYLAVFRLSEEDEQSRTFESFAQCIDWILACQEEHNGH